MHLDGAAAARRRAPSSTVSVGGFRGEIPEPIAELSSRARSYYDVAWRSPVAASWVESDLLVVEEWASLKALVAKKFADDVEPQASILSQVRAREIELGLTPKSRLANRVRVVDDEPDSFRSEDQVPTLPAHAIETLRRSGVIA